MITKLSPSFWRLKRIKIARLKRMHGANLLVAAWALLSTLVLIFTK